MDVADGVAARRGAEGSRAVADSVHRRAAAAVAGEHTSSLATINDMSLMYFMLPDSPHVGMP